MKEIVFDIFMFFIVSSMAISLVLLFTPPFIRNKIFAFIRRNDVDKDNRIRYLQEKIAHMEITNMMAREGNFVNQSYLEAAINNRDHTIKELKARLANNQQTFSQEEINRLVRLCHPDKHNNSPASNEMTVKLNQIRALYKNKG